MTTDGGRNIDTSESNLVAHLQDVTRQFDGSGGVQDLTLPVPRGQIVGLVGPSGSGKTTTVRLLLGIDRPERGDIRVFASPPHRHLRRDRRRIGYLPQHQALSGDLSVRHNLQFMASLYGLPSRLPFLPGERHRAARERIDHLLDLLDLQEVADTRLGNASGGERRRLALATALVHEPDLLVLDEPTSGIDPVLRKRLWDHFTSLRDEGVTLLVTTQYVGEAVHCDLLALLVDGRVIALDTPEALRERALGADAPPDASFDDVFVELVERHRAGADRARRSEEVA